MEKVLDHLQKLVPEARITMAHGRMREKDLENIMMDFFNRKTDVLLCTSIIGSGLDIPTANTIIVDRADAFGLADLYQLKGRVGRSSLQGYAYFLIAGEDALTDEARKRIHAIQEMSYLGAGFRLALKDLEIRGAGNLLGAEQSGHICKVGFDMYNELLEKAVAELKGESVADEREPQVTLALSAYLPETYISDDMLRLSFYKRLSSVKSLEKLSEFREEIIDRFGSLPAPVHNLFHIVRIKLFARQLFIAKIISSGKGYRFSFNQGNQASAAVNKQLQDFFDRLLKALFDLNSNPIISKQWKFRFLPDGFMLAPKEPSSTNPAAIEQLLDMLDKSMH
jgi:transcription-repair coupling factor (superfamily II helicase)